ncbi:MAG: hypothetical protein ACR2NX_11390 [Chthoniobacterales bacterium]
MKPTLQFSRSTRQGEALRPLYQITQRPLTDWSFQTTSPDLRGGARPFHLGARSGGLRPAFHTLSQGFFSTEADRESRLEGALFGFIAVLAAWPIVLAAQAALTLIK